MVIAGNCNSQRKGCLLGTNTFLPGHGPHREPVCSRQHSTKHMLLYLFSYCFFYILSFLHVFLDKCFHVFSLIKKLIFLRIIHSSLGLVVAFCTTFLPNTPPTMPWPSSPVCDIRPWNPWFRVGFFPWQPSYDWITIVMLSPSNIQHLHIVS